MIFPGDSYAEVEEKVFDWLEAGMKMVTVVTSRKRSATMYRSLVNIAVLTETDVRSEPPLRAMAVVDQGTCACWAQGLSCGGGWTLV